MAKKASKPMPEGMHSVTPYLWFDGDCHQAIDFYQKAFGAELTSPPVPGPGGQTVMHSMLKIGDSNIMMADAWPGSWEHGAGKGATATLWVYVKDCDALFKKAVNAGCEVLMQMEDAFWGDRHGKVKDPFGHCWTIATFQLEFTPKEMSEREQEWLAKLQGE